MAYFYYVCIHTFMCPKRPEEGVRSSEARVTGSCELQSERVASVLTAKPSLQSSVSHLSRLAHQ